MRNNLPIIDEQITIPEHYRLVSRTDLKGTILEANFEFIEISGYSKDEIIGQPHNIVRHPDVPEAVFKDLWRTLQSGNSWTQIVKNRTKDGRHYWVKANATPVVENEKITGYISIRKPATPEEIKSTTIAYQKINQGKLIIEKGHVFSPFKYKLKRINPFQKLNLVNKLIAFSAMLILLGLLVVSFITLTQYQIAKQETENKRSLEIEFTLDTFIENVTARNLFLAASISTDPFIRISLEQNTHKSQAQYSIDKLVSKLTQQNIIVPRIFIHTSDGKAFFRSWTDKSGDDLTGFRYSVNQIRTNQKQAFSTFELGRSGLPLRTLVPINSEIVPDKYVGSLEVMTSTHDFTAFFKKKDIAYFAILTAESLKQADLVKSDYKFQGYAIINAKHQNSDKAKYLSKIDLKELLQNQELLSSTYFIISLPIHDLNNKLIGYHILMEDSIILGAINEALFSQATQTIINTGIALILLALAFLMLVFFNVIRPIKGLSSIIQKATFAGDLTLRANDKSQDELGQLAKAYNDQMQTMQVIMGESGRMMCDLSRGNFTTQTTIPMKGDFSIMSRSLSRTADSMSDAFKEINLALENIKGGNFSFKSSLEFKGEFKAAINKVEAVMLLLQNIFSEINKIMSQVANGHFNARIVAEVAGEMNLLKENINATLNQLELVISVTSNNMIAQGSGDLESRINEDFGGSLKILKDGINNSVANISGLILQSNYSIYQLSSGAEAIAEDINDLSSRTQQQEASIEETAASMEEITSTIQKTASNALSANNMAVDSLKEAKQANEVVQNTILSINDINDASKKIAEITSLIDSIAFQTNLLALNAAVEAARAGEHGRGFAVVAGEVRNLAGKSAQAAKDIRLLINDTVKKVAVGASLAQESGEALKVINNSVAQISGLVKEITQTTAEQSKGAEQVNVALTSIDQATQKNAALVEETATRAVEMKRLSDSVLDVVKTFKIDAKQIDFNTAMQTGEFAFATAKLAHKQLKGTVVAYVRGIDVDFNEEEATNHRLCKVGKWFYGADGQKYAHLPEMQTVNKYHAEFHALVKQILADFKSANIEAVEAGLIQLDEASALVVDSLDKAEVAVTRFNEKANNNTAKNTPRNRIITTFTTEAKTDKKAITPAVIPKKPKPTPVISKPAIVQTPVATVVTTKPKVDGSEEWGEF